MEKLPVAELDFSKLDGLITVVTQASETGEVLMQAFANREALELTLPAVMPITGHDRGESFGRKEKVPEMFRKSTGFWWTVTLMPLSTKSNRRGRHAIQVQQTVFFEKWTKIKNDLEPLTQ